MKCIIVAKNGTRTMITANNKDEVMKKYVQKVLDIMRIKYEEYYVEDVIIQED